MLTMQDCRDWCDLSEQEVLAIAEHENLNEIGATSLGQQLVETPDGEKRVRGMIDHDIDAARNKGDSQRTASLRQVLRQYVEHHHGGSLRLRARRAEDRKADCRE